MPNTGLGVAYLRSEIDQRVPEGETMGVYVWGYFDPADGLFVVSYVGRSDNNADGLRSRLHSYDGTNPRWTHFKFSFVQTMRQAFELESTIWHEFKLRDLGQIHPRRPDGTDYPCAVGGMACFEQD